MDRGEPIAITYSQEMFTLTGPMSIRVVVSLGYLFRTFSAFVIPSRTSCKSIPVCALSQSRIRCVLLTQIACKRKGGIEEPVILKSDLSPLSLLSDVVAAQPPLM